MRLIKKIILVLSLLTALPHFITFSSQPINNEIIALKSAQSED